MTASAVPAPAAPARGPGPSLPSLPAAVPGGAPAVLGAARATGIVAVGLLLAAALLAPSAVLAAGLPLAVGGILLGIPHGAVDHVVPFWTAGRPVTGRPLAAVLTAYLCLAGAATAAFLLAPGPTLLAFLLLSVVHFGRGEVVVVAEHTGRPVPGPRQDVLPVLAHGAAVVGLPVALWPATSLPLLEQLAPRVADLPAATPRVLGLAVAGLVTAAVVVLLRSRRHLEAAELLLLAATFALVPPLAAFGVYFGLWHALRHTARLVTLPGPLGPLPVTDGVRRYLVHAALPTAGALALLAALWSTRTPSVLTAALATLLALTFPHARVVAALDARSAGGRAPVALPG